MSLLERVLEHNTSFPFNESEKFAVITASDKLLAEYAEVEAPSGELTYAVIRLLRYLKRYKPALALMQQRRPSVAAKAREVDFYELELHYICGERETAEALLAKFEITGKFRPSWKRSIDKLRHKSSTRDMQQELATSEAAIGRLDHVDPELVLRQLQHVLKDANQALEIATFVEERLLRLRALTPAEAEEDLSVFDNYHLAALIFACGFSWSGSGAVAAFLSQHKAITLPYQMSELGYLQGRAGREGIFSFLKTEAMSFPEMQKRLARFLAESIVCLSAIKHHYSVVMQCSQAAGGRVTALGELMDDFHRCMLGAAALASLGARRKILGAFLERLFSLGGGTHALLNNAFMASRIELADVMEHSRFIAVERDARDQFIARRTEAGDLAGKGVAEFASMVTNGRSAFQRIHQGLDPSVRQARIALLRFETFIQNEEERLRLLDWLGLPHSGLVPDKGRFDASVSAGNVGIHVGRITPEEAADLETGLGLYMR